MSESDVRAPLQLMLDLTVRRLLLNPDIAKKIFDLQNKFKNVKLEFIYKLGKYAACKFFTLFSTSVDRFIMQSG